MKWKYASKTLSTNKENRAFHKDLYDQQLHKRHPQFQLCMSASCTHDVKNEPEEYLTKNLPSVLQTM